jgi:uncharacterized protein YjbI with pentapeptide repeats
MKTVKPQRLGLTCRTFEAGGKVQLAVTALVGSPFAAPRAIVHEAALWKLLGGELGPDTVPDIGMPKLVGELLVSGSAFARAGTSTTATAVRVAMGAIDKTAYVVGDRTWRGGVASDPEPFTEMPLAWDRAFGGPGHATNPIGRGFAPVATDAGPVHPLPNVEDPKRLVRSPKDRPAPVGFAPLGFDSPLRPARTGTYDDAWLAKTFPGLPHDFDFAAFSTAPADQRLPGFFRGDEAFVVEHMNADEPRQEGRLPGFVARIFVRMAGDDALREVPMHLETVHLLPRASRAVLLFRGVVTVSEDDASDVRVLLGACEELGAPRPLDHYRAVLEERLDKKRGALASLRDADLMPAGEAASTSLAELVDGDLGTPFENLKSKALARRSEAERAAARERMRAAGLDPDEHIPPEPASSAGAPPAVATGSIDEVGAVVERVEAQAAALRAELEARRAQAEASARASMSAAGLDYDAAVEAEKQKPGGPPKPRAAAELERLRDLAALGRNAGTPFAEVEAALADPSLPAKLASIEDAERAAYRRMAHHQNAAALADEGTTTSARAAIEASRATGASLARRDFTGVDLAGLDLSGLDLSGAFLERANLAGANLARAKLDRAVLARADLSGATLTGASLAQANLAKASLRGAKLDGGVDLGGAVLTGADLREASLAGARLDRVDLTEAKLDGADLGGAHADDLTLMGCDLRGARFVGARFHKCNFIDVDLGGVDLSGADLEASAFVGVRASSAVFRGANLARLRVVRESCLDGADFAGARLDHANLRATRLAGARFHGASLHGADLSECDLRGARFDRAVGREIRLTKADLTGARLDGADLMLALLDRAKLHGTSLAGASLFRADMARVDVDGGTVTSEANLKQIRFVARRPDAKG